MEISKIMKKRIEEMLSKGIRLDERKLEDFRKLEIKIGVSKKAEGSAWVKLGDTEVIAGVKLDLFEPFRDSSDEGVLMVASEFSPLASDRFELGAPAIQSIELARLVDRGLRNCGCINFKDLCIKEGEKVWAVMVDVYPINDDGNLIDASMIAAVAALQNTYFPKLDGEKVQYGELSSKQFKLMNVPTTVTIYKAGNKLFVDPTTDEEDASKVRVTFTFTFPEENMHAIQKVGQELSDKEILEMLDLALKEGKNLNSKVVSLLKKGKEKKED